MSVRSARRGAISAMRRFAPVVAQAAAVNLANLYRVSQSVDNYVGQYPELAPLTQQPSARWLNTQGDADAMGSVITAAAGKTALFTIYAIPGRDSGQYSAGGFPDRASYLSFITTVKTKIGTAPAMLFFEPDALGLTNGMTAATKAERVETLRQAVNILATIPNAETYVDASMWIGTTDQATLQQGVDISKVAGICCNVSGYNSVASCQSYADAVITELANRGVTGKKYVVDTSRAGAGALTEADRPLASPWLDTSQAWCNPPKRRLGPNPTAVNDASHPACRAFMWIKTPGESDGSFPSTSNSTYYGENAPSAGTFWVVQAKMLLGTEPGGANSVPAVRTNYIPNPSFEVTDAVASAAGSRYGSATFSRDTAEKVYGGASLKVVAGSGTVDSGQWEGVALAAGTYTASAWIKTSAVQNAHLVVRTSDYTDLGTQTHVTGTTAWTRYSTTFTLSAAATVHLLVGLGSYGAASSGTAWFDGLMLEPASAVGPYFDGSTSVNAKTVAWTGTAHASTSTEVK